MAAVLVAVCAFASLYGWALDRGLRPNRYLKSRSSRCPAFTRPTAQVCLAEHCCVSVQVGRAFLNQFLQNCASDRHQAIGVIKQLCGEVGVVHLLIQDALIDGAIRE